MVDRYSHEVYIAGSQGSTGNTKVSIPGSHMLEKISVESNHMGIIVYFKKFNQEIGMTSQAGTAENEAEPAVHMTDHKVFRTMEKAVTDLKGELEVSVPSAYSNAWINIIFHLRAIERSQTDVSVPDPLKILPEIKKRDDTPKEVTKPLKEFWFI